MQRRSRRTRPLAVVRACRLAMALVFILAGPSELLAFFLPSFNLDACSWNATDIAIVSEGDVPDGKVTVLEVWRGSLEPGDAISIPGLASFRSAETRRVYTSAGVPTKGILDGKRIVVFLVKKGETWEPAATPAGGLGGLGISSVWIDFGKAHVRSQLRTSGAQIFHQMSNETSIRQYVLQVTKCREDLAAALELTDEAKRIEKLVPIALSGLHAAEESAISEITRAGGERGSEALRELLRNEGLSSAAAFHAMQALRRLEGAGAYAEFHRLLARELAFWQRLEAAPQPGSLGTNTLHDRASLAQYIVEALRGADASHVPLVKSFRDFTQSSRRLAGYRRVLARACDQVLESLGKGGE